MWVDGTIGSATSGATIRANADTQALYTLYYDGYSDTICPVTGGRGASAAADFAADKPLRIPRGPGRALGIAGTGAGGLTVRTLGDNVGAETHNHGGGTGSAGPDQSIQTPGAGPVNVTGGHTHSINSDSSMQPTAFINVMIRL
jgi:hypothetical protein